ncbi:MAG: uroporphyrinogen decarboxylase family protein [Armatimonadota bacterium]
MKHMAQIRRVASGHPVPPGEVPVLLLSQEFDARLCGLSYEQFLASPLSVADTLGRCVREFDYDFGWVHLHDLIEFAPLGVPVKGGGDVVPGAAGHLPAEEHTVQDLRIPPGLAEVGEMPLLLGSLRLLRDRFGDDICVTGRLCAPFSAAVFIFGMTEGMMMTLDNPALLQRAISFFEDYAIALARLQVEAGAHALWIGDCSATTHLISPATYRALGLEPARRVCAAVKEMGAIAFYYPGDDSVEGLAAFSEARPDVLQVTCGADLGAVRRRLGARIPLSGNLHPVELLEQQGPEAVAEETRRTLAGQAGLPFILSSGDSLTRDTPEQNVRAVMAAARTPRR